MKNIRRFMESIKQVIFWLPYVWKTRDFDYNYSLIFFQLKLKRLYDFLSSDDALGIWEEKEKDLLALKRCVNILDLLVDEKYSEGIFDEHYKNFPISLEIDSRERYNSFMNAWNDDNKTHAFLLNEFFELFSKYYRSWWD